MCGIVGYCGNQEALKILLQGLQALEYRGYDSAGISLKSTHRIETLKTKGKVIDLITLITESNIDTKARMGIGHTRWATHGIPSSENAHPHFTDNVSVVHNGIIENYRELEVFLNQRGLKRKTQTDTEIIALLIDFFLKDKTFEEAFKETVKLLKGSFAIASISKDENFIMAAKHESPLVIGLSDNQIFIASDVSAMIEYTNEFIFLEDGDTAKISAKGITIWDKDGQKVKREPITINWSKQTAQKSGYKHFMLKEIAEEDESVRNTIQSRISENGKILLDDEISIDKGFIKNIDRITIVACGTSFYAGLTAKPILEKYTGVKVDVEIGSEFRYYNYIYSKNNLFIAISQSGETADTKEPLRMAKEKGIKTLSIVNVKESAIARMADSCIYTLAGPEISVASTKAFVSQLAVLYMLAFYVGQIKGKQIEKKAKMLLSIPKLIKTTFNNTVEAAKKLAEEYHRYKNFLYLGRGLCYPLALEGALKLKEISYIHAEGYPAGEMKHGPIALIDENTPTVVVAHSKEPLYSKSLSNCEEIKSRDGKIILISDKQADIVDETIKMPEVDYELLPFIYVVPLQLFAYYMALFLGYDIDQPRNLAKSVTVE
ncbi:glutamine--fructose-6-phosphate transaminase (isomerizing) [Hippea maritima]|uniref:Glutamine--fructose-6-phosphate aminotransferase [isomerizing] n=1 Tax=Hippea maritima (strain ATCC 700847 / DSM 10411 / MH2) TaxID=760142 RepID=F2LW93_HIPMA|nr:glutamine--fructose-6-phosphate transaminase (isomerizing) [Hippea maritima]AEA34027.1 Glucosamine--fructose-6-phosphate aminotransferase (isomerizing) [Hippea maritima DSM 10411]